jgi:hypothetical protein
LIVINNNLGSFFILVTINGKNLIVLEWIDELVSIILEDLPPVRVGACDLHVFAASITYDVP